MNCLPTIQFRHDLWYVDGGLYGIARALGRLMDLDEEQIANAIEGKPVTQAINMDTSGPLQAMIDKAVLDANPDFKGEWAQ